MTGESKGVDTVKTTYQQGQEDIFNIMKNNCKHSHFTFDRDSHCSGYNYCMLKGFDCVCCYENCGLIKRI